MSAVSVLMLRLTTEEGEKILPYDDATGLNVKAPTGNLSWGRGFNLMQCGSSGLFEVMEEFLLSRLDAQLQAYSWYRNAGDARASVFLDIAYNAGLHGLLNFPHMLAAAANGDWVTASSQCAVQNASLDSSRYAPLRKILLDGTT